MDQHTLSIGGPQFIVNFFRLRFLKVQIIGPKYITKRSTYYKNFAYAIKRFKFMGQHKPSEGPHIWTFIAYAF